MLAEFALWVPKHCKSLCRRWLRTRGGLWRNGWSLSLPWSCLHLYFQVQAPTARIYGPLLMKRPASSLRIVMSRRARLGNPGGKFIHCIRVGGQSEATVLFPIRKAFQIRRTWLREGSRCVNVLLLPESLYLICPPYVGRHSGGELFS